MAVSHTATVAKAIAVARLSGAGTVAGAVATFAATTRAVVFSSAMNVTDLVVTRIVVETTATELGPMQAFNHKAREIASRSRMVTAAVAVALAASGVSSAATHARR